MGNLNVHKMTWAALLSRWIQFARSAVALPDTPEGRAMRAAVPDIIALQAVTMALGDLDSLAPEERPLGIDRARVLIEKHSRQIDEYFPGERHAALTELIESARQALCEVEGLYCS